MLFLICGVHLWIYFGFTVHPVSRRILWRHNLCPASAWSHWWVFTLGKNRGKKHSGKQHLRKSVLWKKKSSTRLPVCRSYICWDIIYRESGTSKNKKVAEEWNLISDEIRSKRPFYAKNGLLHAFEVNEKCALCTNVLLKWMKTVH